MKRPVTRKPLKIVSLALLIALTGASLAQARMRGDFDTADANHDGRVTLPEYQNYANVVLSEAHGRFAQRFKRLSPDDQAKRIQKRFEKADRGHKGYLDRGDWND